MHYIFGKLKDSFSIESIFKEAEKKRKCLRNYSIDKIIDILDKVSNLWADPSYHLRKKAMEIMPKNTNFHPSMIKEELNFLVDLLKRENLEKRVKCELRDKNFIDDWYYSEDLKGHLKAEPRGVVVHISAGNVFVGPLDSVIQGILTKNVNILKLSSDDPVFPLLFCQSLKEMDKDGIVSSSICALSWKGGDEKTESVVKKEADAIVVYGGAKAVEAYRNGLGLHTKLIEYGPKYSLVLISKEIFEIKENNTVIPAKAGIHYGVLDDIAFKIAHDASRWEQSACASPHVIYVEENCNETFDTGSRGPFPALIEKNNDTGSRPERREGRAPKKLNAERLIEKLGAAFEKVQKILPQKNLTVDEQVEITKTRQLAMAAETEGAANYKFGNDKSAWSVIFEKDPRFTISCLNRTIFVKPVGYRHACTLQDVPKILEPMGKYIQTVAIEAPDEIRKKIANSFSFIGADRFTELGKMTSRVHGTPHDGVYSLQELIRWSSLTGESRRAGADSQKIMNIVDYAVKNSQFYKNKFKSKIENIDDFSKLPIISPAELKKHLPPKGKGALTGIHDNGYVFTSGGTTGDPKFVFRTTVEQDYNAGFLAKGLLNAALDKGDTVANLLFAGNMWGSFLSFSKALEKAGCRILPVGGNISTEEILNYLILFKPDAVLAIPSVLLSLANLIETKKLKIKIPKIISGGEHIFKENVKYLKKVFNADRLASIGYATNDVGAIGYQCRHLSGGFHHIHNELQYVEILNPKTLKPVKMGEEGKVIVTNLNRRLQPIIRYDVGDMGRWIDKKCPCGEPGPIFELLGRSDEVLIIGGGNIFPEVIREAIAKIGGLSPHFTMTAQLKNGKDQLVVKVESCVPGTQDCKITKKLESQIYSNSKELSTMLSKGLIASVVVEVLPPHTLPRNPRTGKLRLVEDKRK